MVVGILPVGQHVHVPGVVGPLVGHPGASIHADGVAAAQVGVEIGAVVVALVVTAEEVLVFIEGDLKRAEGEEWGGSSSSTCLPIPATPRQEISESRALEISEIIKPSHGTGPAAVNSPVWPQCLQLPPAFCPSQTLVLSQSNPTLSWRSPCPFSSKTLSKQFPPTFSRSGLTKSWPGSCKKSMECTKQISGDMGGSSSTGLAVGLDALRGLFQP